jgi:phage shock protein A
MADLKPIGSEKLQGQDKINRILEIARYKENIPNSVNESSRVEFGKTLADGNQYEIVKEKLGYVIKKKLNESLDYLEPMKNRKYYKSYSQALKRMNLLAGELNRLTENQEEVSMFNLEEQKKFTLKLPKQEMPVSEPVAEPADAVSDELPMDDTSRDMNMDVESGDDSLDMDMEMDTEAPEMGADEEEVDFKVIQKLTGKLGQKIRTMNDSVGMTSEDIKYVLNSILSALDLEKLDDEDKEDVIAKIEEVETDYDSTEMDLDMTGDEEMDMDLDMDLEGETTEGSMFLGQRQGDKDRFYDEMDREYLGDFDFDYDEEEFDDYDTFMSKVGDQKWFAPEGGKMFFDKYRDQFGPFKFRKRKEMGEGGDRDKFDGRDSKVIGVYSNIKKQRNEEMSEEEKTHSSISKIMDGIFGESKVDKVLEKYFVISEDEKKTESKKTKKSNSIQTLAETTEQRLAAEFIMKESKDAKFLGKTNKNNLVIENQGVQIKITTKGEVL